MSLISSNDALQTIREIEIKARPTRPLWLSEAVGHVLAEDIVTCRDIPPFDRAAMDGYALRSVDVQNVPCRLAVVAVQQAGSAADISLSRGQCVKIMTGAAVPADADAVVMIENTESDDPGRSVVILEAVKPFMNIAPKGQDASAGSVVLRKGQVLTGQALSVAAGVGQVMLQVCPPPEVSLLQTGGELLEPGTPANGHGIYNSNATLLAGLLHDVGLARPRYQGICPDDPEALALAIGEGLKDDLLLITGGVSKGDFDYVPEVLQHCGVTLQFHGMATKPGKPMLFGSTAEGSFVFGLPGNPVSVMVCFYEYVLPFLRRLAGWQGEIMPADLKATLTAAVSKKPGRVFNCPSRLTWRQGQWFAKPLPGHGSGDYVTAAQTNGVVVFPAESKGAEQGTQVIAHLWQMPLSNPQEM